MMKKVYLLLLCACLVVAMYPVNSTYGQGSETATTCQALIPRLNHTFLLRFTEPRTNQQVAIEQLAYHYTFRYSPDCRFIIGNSTGVGDCNPGLIIWNANTGERMQAFTGFCDTTNTTYPHLIWKPDYSAVVISEWYRGWNASFSWQDRYLWYPNTNQLVLLEDDSEQFVVEPTLFQVEWDEARNWVWTSGISGIAAFDGQSGLRTIDFPNPPEIKRSYVGTSTFFTFSPDRTHVIAHGQRDVQNWMTPMMTVYDIASGIGVQVNPERNADGKVALSPDNRYLIMSYSAIRVWDLNNLAADVADRLPIYRLPQPVSLNSRVYFSDNTTLIAESNDGVTRFVYTMTTGERLE
jgi:hypothetical protein